MNMRETLSRLREWRSRRSLPLAQLRESLSPVFIVGGNRSGTSMVSSILSQHPDLEGIFSGETDSTYNEADHSNGFCESYHLWKFLIDPKHDKRAEDRQLPFWALPQYLNGFYRNRPRNRKEIFEIVWDLHKHRETGKPPLVKNQYNTFRIGLMAEVFPRARFVLVSRPWDNFIERGVHKWTHDGSNTALSPDHPRAGFHWHLLNLIVRYDLETYASGRYAEIWLDTLHSGPDPAQKAFQNLLKELSLATFIFDLKVLEPQWLKHRKQVRMESRADFAFVRRIVEFERRILSSMSRDSEGGA